MKKAILILAVIAALYAVHGAMTIDTVSALSDERTDKIDRVLEQAQ